MYSLRYNLHNLFYMNKMIIEAHVPFLRGVFEPYFNKVEYLSSAEINQEAVKDADALIVRTRNKCNSELLSGSDCKFIGTATIGTDHIDFEYCKEHNISVASAPGCNAPAVEQYVMSVIGNWMQKEGITHSKDLTLGIIGVGHVGTLVASTASDIGLNTLLCDPPRRRRENSDIFRDLNTVLEHSDIITIHTPLNRTGIDATYHLVNDNFIAKATKCRLLINAARGAITSTETLLKVADKIDLAIDCFENEPDINRTLLEKAYIGTPHIAGYSMEGKLRGSLMMIDAVARHFNLPINLKDYPSFTSIITNDGKIKTGTDRSASMAEIMGSYNPHTDSDSLKRSPEKFEYFRNNYKLRHEPSFI